MQRKFSLTMVAKTNSESVKAKVPRVRDLPDKLEANRIQTVKPSEEIHNKLGQPHLVVGVDIETADWTPSRHNLRKGQFGFHTMCSPEVFNQKLIQIGWCVSDLNGAKPFEELQEIIIQPDGFVISEKATKLHGVSTYRALQDGVPVKMALDMFMHAMQRADRRGARIVVHHLEFDAGIIDKELASAGLQHWRPQWQAMAKAGFCTMDPTVGEWIQRSCGRDFDKCENSMSVMSLQKTIELLSPILPTHEVVQNFRANGLHTASSDAQLHCLIYKAMRELASNDPALAHERAAPSENAVQSSMSSDCIAKEDANVLPLVHS